MLEVGLNIDLVGVGKIRHLGSMPEYSSSRYKTGNRNKSPAFSLK